MSKQKLLAIATGTLMFGFLSGYATSLLAQVLRPSEANIRIVAGIPEVPRDENGHPLPAVEYDENALKKLIEENDLVVNEAQAIVLYMPSPKSEESEESAGLLESPAGGLAHPGHRPPPRHCYIVIDGYSFQYHC